MATLPAWPPPPARTPAAPRSSAAAPFEWIFEDPRSKALLAEVEQVAPSDATVLITGETGTGKELIARHIHQRSARREGPFVTVSCGAFSEALVDAELFGHENGAFAGAFGTQIGWFEQANGGTIFLDEVNDLPLSVQNKLLRVLQERAVIRIGGSKPIPIDVRILAATTADLQALVEHKRFRKDLFYRLDVVRLEVLTLRERPGDIVPLARYFLDLYSKRLGYPALTLSADAERLLMRASWHGNVRELENAIHRALLLSDGDRIDAVSLRLSARRPTPAASVEPRDPQPGDGARIAPAGAAASEPSGIAADARGQGGQGGAGGSGAAGAGGATIDAEPVVRLAAAIRALCEADAPALYQVVEDTLIREVFRFTHYSQSETARMLGISRNVVRARLIRLGEVGAPRREA